MYRCQDFLPELDQWSIPQILPCPCRQGYEKARGIEIGFGKLYGVDRLIILSPRPSNVDSVDKSKEQVIIKIFELKAGLQLGYFTQMLTKTTKISYMNIFYMFYIQKYKIIYCNTTSIPTTFLSHRSFHYISISFIPKHFLSFEYLSDIYI